MIRINPKIHDALKNNFEGYEDLQEFPHIQEMLEKRNTSQEKRWKNQNQILNNQKTGLRTSNKTIANILNLCERQVGYYLKKSIDNFDEKENNSEEE